jgi:hypothetical protein
LVHNKGGLIAQGKTVDDVCRGIEVTQPTNQSCGSVTGPLNAWSAGVVGQHRSTQRHGGKVMDLEEAKLRRRLREIAADHIRWGRRMA